MDSCVFIETNFCCIPIKWFNLLDVSLNVRKSKQYIVMSQLLVTRWQAKVTLSPSLNKQKTFYNKPSKFNRKLLRRKELSSAFKVWQRRLPFRHFLACRLRKCIKRWRLNLFLQDHNSGSRFVFLSSNLCLLASLFILFIRLVIYFVGWNTGHASS